MFAAILIAWLSSRMGGCSERPPLNRSVYETSAAAEALKFVIRSISDETKQEAQIAYLSLGNYVADAATEPFVKSLGAESLRFVDGSGFRDKAFAGKRFIVDTSTPDELTPLMLQVRSGTATAKNVYRYEIGWAFKEMLSRKIYEVDERSSPAAVRIVKAIDVRNVPGETDVGPAAKAVDEEGVSETGPATPSSSSNGTLPGEGTSPPK